jgi:hypothetical protein
MTIQEFAQNTYIFQSDVRLFLWYDSVRNEYSGNHKTLSMEKTMAEHIGDESAYLRLNELLTGKIQFTDATNASRLVAEQGRDIRYNAAWEILGDR